MGWLERLSSCHTPGEAERIHSQILKSFVITHDNHLYISSKLIEMYVRCGSLKHAQAIYDGLAMVDSFCAALLLSAYCRQGDDLFQAKQFFDSLPGEQLLVSWNTMISAFGRRGQLEQAKMMFDQIPLRCLISWNSMLAAYARVTQLERAKQIFDTMPERNLISWTAMLSAYAAKGQHCEAEQMFAAMPQRNIFSWNALLSSHGLAEGLHILEKTKQMFVARMPEHDIVSSTLILSAYARHGYAAEAKQAFDGMKERDIFAWNTMLSAYAQNKSLEEARVMFELMPQRCLVSWNAMLNAYTSNGLLEEAKLLFDSMPQKNSRTWSSMLCGYAESGCLEDAKLMFDELRTGDRFLWTVLLKAYINRGELDHAGRIFLLMPERDVVVWTALLDAYSRLGRFRETIAIFDAVKLLEEPDSACFLSVLRVCSHAGKTQAGRGCFFSMINDFGIVSSSKHYSCMVDLIGRGGFSDDARELISAMPYFPESLDYRSLLNSSRLATNNVGNKGALSGELLDGSAFTLLSNVIKH